jgi:hypothetical protein
MTWLVKKMKVQLNRQIFLNALIVAVNFVTPFSKQLILN